MKGERIIVKNNLDPLKILYRIVNYGGLAALVVWGSLGIEYKGIMQTEPANLY